MILKGCPLPTGKYLLEKRVDSWGFTQTHIQGLPPCHEPTTVSNELAEWLDLHQVWRMLAANRDDMQVEVDNQGNATFVDWF